MTAVSDYRPEYPITIVENEFYERTGLRLRERIPGADDRRVNNFLDTIHGHIYDGLIYNTGDRDIKNRIIAAYTAELEKPIKAALTMQAQYVLANEQIELWNGFITTVNGTHVTTTQDILQKVVNPAVVNNLMSNKPDILFAGE
jgi:hypothetical protein